MCANCRQGRGGWLAGGVYLGRSNPFKRRGEGNPRPWFWVRIGKLDLCLMPFDGQRWQWPSRYNEKFEMDLGFYYGYFGWLEVGWLVWK